MLQLPVTSYTKWGVHTAPLQVPPPPKARLNLAKDHSNGRAISYTQMVCKGQYIVIFGVFSNFLSRPHLLNKAKFFLCPTCNILGDDFSSPFHADAFPAFESRRRGFPGACCGVFESVCLCNAEEFKGDGEGAQ